MSRRFYVLAALLLVAGLSLGFAPPPDSSPAPARPAYKLSGPYTHDNLTLFLLHGEDTIKGTKFLTLDEALTQKKVVVHETKNVSELAIENVSDERVFVQAGDIVKGGQQDRTIRNDQVVAPRSGRLPLASFCVEHGRWSQRGGEDAGKFSRCTDQLNDNRLKLAARSAGSQKEVWSNVARVQTMLEKSLKADVKGAESASSLQLTLEHKKVKEAVEGALKKLEDSPGKATDVVGYAVVINGKVNNADVYGNAALFRKLWPKLLRSSVIEAVAAKKEGLKVEPVKAELVTNWLADAEKGKTSEKKVGKDGKEVVTDNDKSVLFDSKGDKGASLRKSYIAR